LLSFRVAFKRRENPSLLNLQVLVLALIPLFSGALPTDGGTPVSPLTLLGREEIPSEFITGAWKYSDEFFRWGATDKERARIKSFRGNAFMILRPDGTMKMVNLFRPKEGRWEWTAKGILLYDPRYPERGTQVLPVKKRGPDSIWVLLPFAGGAAGIGMVRVPESEPERTTARPEKAVRRQSSPPREEYFITPKPDPSDPTKLREMFQPDSRDTLFQ
jgi:hypothetical protein